MKYLFLLMLVFAFPGAVHAEVMVYDAVALTGEEILIKAETKSGYFAKGGKIAEFSINGKSIGSVLSGSDGIAFKTFKMNRPGAYTVVVKRGKDTGSGNIMVLKKGSKIVFIDVDGSLLATPFTKKPIELSKIVIRKIMNRYAVVYLHAGDIGMRAVKDWLRRNRFPDSAVLPWQGGDVFAEVNKRGLKIQAVIGSQEVIASSNDYHPAVFSFDDQDSSGNLKTWQEIEKDFK